MAYINGKKVLTVVRTAYLDLDTVYPVGAIYISANSTSPASLFGGTWQRISDKFLYGTSNDAQIGDTGGAATHTHTLNNGYAKLNYYWDGSKNTIALTTKFGISYNADKITFENMQGFNEVTNSQIAGTALGGTTDSGDNMPPNIKVAIWKRTA